jgi:hypothetical protein
MASLLHGRQGTRARYSGHGFNVLAAPSTALSTPRVELYFVRGTRHTAFSGSVGWVVLTGLATASLLVG